MCARELLKAILRKCAKGENKML